jgi:hypothetical protein
MLKAVLVMGPRRGMPMNRLVAVACEIVSKACSVGSGRGALEQVQLPDGIRMSQLSPRARRLLRQAQISPW